MRAQMPDWFAAMSPQAQQYVLENNLVAVQQQVEQAHDQEIISKPVAQEPEQQTAVAEPEPYDQEEVDDQIKARAVVLLEQKLTDEEVKKTLNDEYDGLDNEFLSEVVSHAHEKLIDDQDAERDQLRKTATDATDKAIAAQQEADKHLVEKYEIAGRLHKSIDTNDKERAAKIIRMHEDKEEQEESFEDAGDEPFPECPIFPGALTDLARALYPSLPLEFKQWGMIVRWGLLRSGLDRLETEPHLQPRFYTVLVSQPNRGKTASIKESYSAITDVVKQAKTKASDSKTIRTFANVETLPSADSGPFLVQEFFEQAKESNKQYVESICADDRAKILLDPDELSDVFEKARTSVGRVSTLFIELLKLHSGNRTGNGTKHDGNRTVDNAHLAILAGTTVKKYPMLWTGTGGSADGLVSRFLAITTNAKQVPPVQLPSDFAAAIRISDKLAILLQLPGQTIRLSQQAIARLTEWWESFDNSKESATRIMEAVKQLLIVLAVTNAPDGYSGTKLMIGPELVEQAIRFGNYEMAVRERLNPGDSWTHVQAMENTIIAWARKHAGRRLPKTKNEFRRGIHPQRMPGGLGTFKLAWDNCVSTGVLKAREQGQRGYRYSL